MADLDEALRKFQVAKIARNSDGEIVSTVEVPEREPFKQMPDGVLKRRSTLVDAEGNVIQTWHIESPEAAAQLTLFQEMLDEARRDLPRYEPITEPKKTLDDYLAVYPVGDHHMGMLAWKYEVGDSYDLDLGEELLGRAGEHLTEMMLPATHCVVAFLGDFLHYDSMVPVTPTSKNQLDNEGRASKMVRAAWRTMRRMIEMAAARHQHVHVIIEFGNHDPFSTLWLMELARCVYENNLRITVDTAPGAYHYYRLGKVMLGTHHGDKAKLERLPLIMASDRAADWGASTYRVILTGHIHQQKVLDLPGCTVESFRILPPPDAWAHQMGYRPLREMKGILYDIGGWEVSRYTFNPEMLK